MIVFLIVVAWLMRRYWPHLKQQCRILTVQLEKFDDYFHWLSDGKLIPIRRFLQTGGEPVLQEGRRGTKVSLTLVGNTDKHHTAAARAELVGKATVG